MIYVVIPTYNERENICDLVKKIFGLGIENLNILVIDDNSPDGTYDALLEIKDTMPLEIIKRSGKMGLGSAYIHGFKYALSHGAEIIIEMDADFSHNPNKIPELIQCIKEGNDLCIGSRCVNGGCTIGWDTRRKIFSKSAQTFSRLMLGLKTKDVTGGFRCYHRKIFDKIDLDKIRSKGYSFQEEMLFYIEKAGFKVKEIPISFIDRERGKSKLHFREALDLLKNVIRLKFKK
ncbi:MAG: polyprenol monophosphomannose synthase [Patescibacteria group bacterium]|nr:polyprenol monophosphomannose synthase [Patescibacteria group bacterium]